MKFYGVCSKRYPIYIVTEYITNGCLLSYLKSHGKRLEPSQLLEMCYDVCEGMAFLESHQFIHRDLVRKDRKIPELTALLRKKGDVLSDAWVSRSDGQEGLLRGSI